MEHFQLMCENFLRVICLRVLLIRMHHLWVLQHTEVQVPCIFCCHRELGAVGNSHQLCFIPRSTLIYFNIYMGISVTLTMCSISSMWTY